jgi:hypothetical protein
MCLVDELVNESLSITNILRYIDDYSIYSKYIGEELELNTCYSSPIREGDDIPSFCLYKTNNKIKFKDFARAELKGDIFDFVKILIGKEKFKEIPLYRVLQQIDSDFQLGLYTDVGELPKLQIRKISDIKVKDKYTINVTSHKIPTQEFTDYWENKYDITEDILKMYNCTNPQILHFTSKSNKFHVYPKSLCISYQIGGKYKIYFPFEHKSKKFRNDFPSNWVEGYMQLKRKNNFFIITKAMKEVMFFRKHFDWDTVAGKSETTMIPNHLMIKLFNDYEKGYIWLDRDEAGRQSQKDYIAKYPNLIPIVYPDYITQKDVTDRYDFMKQAGLQQIALNEIKQLINK